MGFSTLLFDSTIQIQILRSEEPLKTHDHSAMKDSMTTCPGQYNTFKAKKNNDLDDDIKRQR